VIDAGVLGRHRTGDETHVRELLKEVGRHATGLRIGAVLGDPGLAPHGVTALELAPFNQFTRIAWELPRLLRSVDLRLAHFQYLVPPLYRGPSVITVHDLSFELLPELEERFDGWALRRFVPVSARRARVIFTVSEWTRQDILRRYHVPPERVLVTLNGVSSEFRPDGPRPNRPPYILFVGALRPRKDPLNAVEAFSRLEGLDLRLVMVGPDKGLYPRVESLIDRHGLTGRVELKGYVTGHELAAMYRGAECVLLPSLYEGFGLPVVEAMASGTPVVATNVGAIPEIAGDAAILVPPSDPDALAQGVNRALDARDQFVERGFDRAKMFTWNEVMRRTIDGYRLALRTC